MNKFNFLNRTRISLQEKILFCRHLAIAIKSGMTLIDSLKMIRNQAQTRGLKKILDSLIKDISGGNFLSKGLERFYGAFGELFISVIKVAEASGTLPENLNYLAEELKKRHEIIVKVRNSMIYPAIIMVVTIVIATSMMIFVFPKLLPIFTSLKVELPLTTKILIAIAKFLSAYGIPVLIGVVVLVIAVRLFMKIGGFKFFAHEILIYLPLFGRIVIDVNTVNTSRTLSLLLKSGVGIVEAIEITGKTLTNVVYQRHLHAAADMVRRGEFLSKYFTSRSKYFPSIFTNMVAVGENTGNLTQNLDYLSEYYENEVDEFLKNLSSIVEPILLIFMGVVVGFIALSFITPIYKITQGVR